MNGAGPQGTLMDAGSASAAGSGGARGSVQPPPVTPFAQHAIADACGVNAAGTAGEVVGGESFGDPIAEAMREMETALADTHLHAVGLHVELKQTKQELEKANFEKERAMNLGTSTAAAATEKVAELQGQVQEAQQAANMVTQEAKNAVANLAADRASTEVQAAAA